MLNVHTEQIGDVAVIQCEGRLVRSEAAFKLRDAVTKQADARVVLLDLSEVNSVEGGGLGMLEYLHRWTRDHGVELKLYDPPDPVRQRLERDSTQFQIASTDEILSLLGWEGAGRGIDQAA